MGINTPKKNRNAQVIADQRLIDGFNKHATSMPNMMIGGVSKPTKDIVATLQSRIDSAKAALSIRATWQTTIQADHSLRDTTKTFVSGVKQCLLVAFAGHLDTLADFGLTARATHVPTPEENIARTAKAKATRAARHTMGSKQKAAIKGTVTPTVPAIVGSPAPTPTPVTPVPALPIAVTPPPATPAPTSTATAPSPATPAPTSTATASSPATPATPQAFTHPAYTLPPKK